MRRGTTRLLALTLVCLLAGLYGAYSWDPIPVKDDPLVRMPGTQPGAVGLEAPGRCLNCHAGYNTEVEPGFNWMGSMMAQGARDFVYWSCLTVAAQDSIWAAGRPNATDICLRCHFPKGWLEGRSDPTNGSLMAGADYDSVQCDFCHRMYDPYFETTYGGTREGSDWLNYWDETNASGTPSQPAADATYAEDWGQAQGLALFNGNAFYSPGTRLPVSPDYTENGSGQYYVSAGSQKRAPFADAAARHQMFYSRHHKSKYFCGACHDVSNPVLGNLAFNGTPPGDGTTVLTTESDSAHSYYHVERTFSEFMLSDYGQQGGTAGIGPFDPSLYDTSLPNNHIAKCQDCHMRDVVGVGCDKQGVPVRPTDSIEHPNSGQPLHDLTGGNAWVSWVLASAVAGSPNYDATNAALLNQGPAVLTLDLTQGVGLNPVAILAGSDRALQQLQLAASITDLSYNAATGDLTFKVQNQTGHKLISGFPEGRRMFVNVKLYAGGSLIHEINPYDGTVGTLKGLPHSASSPPLGPDEAYADEIVYEVHPSSTLTGENETFHFALATGRYKDNRIPPKGFRIAEAAARISEPVWLGVVDPAYFTAAEYAGGYDAVSLVVPAGADGVEIGLYYQTTSREYMEFLRDEINGTGNLTLSSPTPSGEPNAYVIQTDPWFAQLKAWGNTIWDLWTHNMNVPGAAPVLMTSAAWGNVGPPCMAPVPTLLAADPTHTRVDLTWSNEHSGDPDVIGYKVYYDQAGKAQLVDQVGLTTTYADTGLTNDQEYCYKVASLYAGCESGYSNVLCATPTAGQTLFAGVSQIVTGRYETTGTGKNKVTVFVQRTSFTQGDSVIFRSTVLDENLAPVPNAVVELNITGPESLVISSQPSGADGVAEASWGTSAPNKRGQGGTTPGSYTATVAGVTADGYVWDGVATSAAFTVQ